MIGKKNLVRLSKFWENFRVKIALGEIIAVVLSMNLHRCFITLVKLPEEIGLNSFLPLTKAQALQTEL